MRNLIFNPKYTLILAICFLTLSVKSQCPTINNAYNCSVILNYSVIDNTPPNPCTPAYTCASFNSVTVPANTTNFSLNCTGCSSICNVVITITDVGGTTQNVLCDYNNSGALTVPAGCNPALSLIYYVPATNEFYIK